MQRIGVFVCHCGTNIAATVDVSKVAEAAKHEPGVVYAVDYTFMCSENGQNLIAQAIKDYGLTAIVVCSCSPRMHEATFRKVAEENGVNPYMVEIANIREQCSWVHKNMDEGTPKAITLMKTAVAKVNLDAPLQDGEAPVTKRALVIGGGIAGIQAALDIADCGYKVDIVEKDQSIGGRMAQLDKTFPTLDCSSCILTPRMTEVNQHPNIRLFTYSEVQEVSGFVGNFDVKILKKSRSVREKDCTGCGVCMSKCPSKKIPNEFNRGLNFRTAINIPFAQAIPNVPVIDKEHCIHFKTGKCGICAKVCPSHAVDYEIKDEIIEEKYGAIVVATGFDQIDLHKFGELGYGVSKDVVSSLEYERIMSATGPTGGHILRPSDGKEPKDVVFIQCVGSRCEPDDKRGKTYCSKICCMYTAKQSIMTCDHIPDAKCHVFYIDVRTPGKAFDEFYRRAVEQYGVDYIKGNVGKVTQLPNGKLRVHGVDLLDQKEIELDTDMVVLAGAIEPNPGIRPLATKLTLSIDNNNFLNEAHAKLHPVEAATAGVFMAGTVQGPRDIPETVAQAGAAAVKAVALLSKDKLKTNPCVAQPDELYCNGCSVCANVCPYGAITYIEKEVRDHGLRETRRLAQVNPSLCKGCGACSVACPSGAMNLKGFTNRQIMAEVDSVCQ